MLTLAKCEKAVTISEPMGHPERYSKRSTGSKTPIHWRMLCLAHRIFAVSALPALGTFDSVFSDLRTKTFVALKRFGNPDHYLADTHFISTQRARFGPNFVTIQPTGECVCRSF